MINISNKFVGWTIILSGFWWILQMTFVTLLYTVRKPQYGILSDLSNMLTMLLLIPFLITIFNNNLQTNSLLSWIALFLGGIGILSVSIASAALLTNKIYFLQSLPPVFGGYVLFGVSLLINLWMARANATLPLNIINLGTMVGLGLVSIAGLLTTDLARLFNFNMEGLWKNPLIYPAFFLTPFFFLGYPFWAFKVGKNYLGGKI